MSSAETPRPEAASPPRGKTRARPRSKRLVVWLLFVALLIALYFFGGRMLRAFGHWWVVDDAPVKADAILVLEDDSFRALRCRRAAELYREGWAPVVVATGRYLRPYASIADLMRRDLLELGVPENAVLSVGHGRGQALDEAQVIRGLVKSKGWKQVLFVTLNFHTRRARYYLRQGLEGVAEVRMVAMRDPAFNPDDWWRHRASARLLAREIVYFTTSTLWESPPGDEK